MAFATGVPAADLMKSSRVTSLLMRHEVILLLLLVAELFCFSVFARKFNTAANFANIARHSAEIGLLALAVMPVILAGGIDLSVGSLLGLCAVLFGVFTHDWGLGWAASAMLTLCVGGFAGGLNATLVTVFRLPPLIVTLGTFSVFRGLAEAITQGTRTFGKFSPEFLAMAEGSWMALPVQGWVLAVVALIIGFFVHGTVLGRSWRAIGFASEGARYAGIPVQRRIAWTYVQAGFIAALAALLFTARLGQARADAGTGYELAAITAVVLGGTSIFGGVGTVWGTLLGVTTIAILTNGLARLDAVLKAGIGGELGSLLTGALLLIALTAGAITKALSGPRRRTQAARTS
jgi:rhamnose transport system permease protein